MSIPHTLPPLDVEVTDRFLTLADRALAGRLTGLYLVGSVALGDFVPGASDVDFIAVSDTPLQDSELDTLAGVHRTLRSGPRLPEFSGIYVTWDDLRTDPQLLTRVPVHIDGKFHHSGGFDANPSVWRTLGRYPVALRGPSRPDVHHDPALLREWNVANLNSYWARWVRQHARLLDRGLALLSDESVMWGVSGVARLHYTVATGDVTSKSGACEYALRHLPARWNALVEEARAIRSGAVRQTSTRLERRHEALDFMRFVIADANRLAAQHESGRTP